MVTKRVTPAFQNARVRFSGVSVTRVGPNWTVAMAANPRADSMGAVAAAGLPKAETAAAGYWGPPTANIDFCEPN